MISNMDRHVCNFRHVNKSQLLDIDENEMKRIEKREDICFQKQRKSNALIFCEEEEGIIVYCKLKKTILKCLYARKKIQNVLRV